LTSLNFTLIPLLCSPTDVITRVQTNLVGVRAGGEEKAWVAERCGEDLSGGLTSSPVWSSSSGLFCNSEGAESCRWER